MILLNKDRFQIIDKVFLHFAFLTGIRKVVSGCSFTGDAYSVPAAICDWYPREMYMKGTKCRKYHLKHYGENVDYRQFVEQFNPTEFDAEDEWLDLFKKSGAKYIMYDSKPFTVYGEGKKQKSGSFKENFKYGKQDFRFTYKNSTIYVFVMSNKPCKEYKVQSLRVADEGGINVELLGSSKPIKWNQDEKAFYFSVDSSVNRSVPLCIKLSVD